MQHQASTNTITQLPAAPQPGRPPRKGRAVLPPVRGRFLWCPPVPFPLSPPQLRAEPPGSPRLPLPGHGASHTRLPARPNARGTTNPPAPLGPPGPPGGHRAPPGCTPRSGPAGQGRAPEQGGSMAPAPATPAEAPRSWPGAAPPPAGCAGPGSRRKGTGERRRTRGCPGNASTAARGDGDGAPRGVPLPGGSGGRRRQRPVRGPARFGRSPGGAGCAGCAGCASCGGRAGLRWVRCAALGRPRPAGPAAPRPPLAAQPISAAARGPAPAAANGRARQGLAPVGRGGAGRTLRDGGAGAAGSERPRPSARAARPPSSPCPPSPLRLPAVLPPARASCSGSHHDKGSGGWLLHPSLTREKRSGASFRTALGIRAALLQLHKDPLSFPYCYLGHT